jgi:hypothetical protein
MNKKINNIFLYSFAILCFSLASCGNNCSYSDFYSQVGKRFIYQYSKPTSEIKEILVFDKTDYYHTTIINDSAISDTSIYSYDESNGTITLKKFINRHLEYEVKNVPYESRMHFSCDGISCGDVYYKLVE